MTFSGEPTLVRGSLICWDTVMTKKPTLPVKHRNPQPPAFYSVIGKTPGRKATVLSKNRVCYLPRLGLRSEADYEYELQSGFDALTPSKGVDCGKKRFFLRCTLIIELMKQREIGYKSRNTPALVKFRPQAVLAVRLLG